jgi:hypothetical protein
MSIYLPRIRERIRARTSQRPRGERINPAPRAAKPAPEDKEEMARTIN